MMSALDTIESLARQLIVEPNDALRGPTDFHAIEANERHEGHRQVGHQLLEIIRSERLTAERIKSLTNEEITERLHRFEDLTLKLLNEQHRRSRA